MTFNEDSRVKIPALVHLTRLGYTYVSLKHEKWDRDTNIFPELFSQAVLRINPDITPPLIQGLKREIGLLLENEDLGRAFYQRLIQPHGLRLIDFDDFDNNSFHVVTELPCINGNEEFRPDITLLINGMPLVFIEVKKPNNRDGILAERTRIRTRFQNPKFRRFVNITQLMMFSNNMEYDDQDPEPIQGAFYATPSTEDPVFNYFREEDPAPVCLLQELDPAEEARILADTNLHALFHFNLDNAEEFSRQISQMKERGHMLEVVRALDNARDLYNVIRQAGHYDLLDRLDFKQLTTLRTEARNHLALINQKLTLENHTDTTNILNLALEDILFTFRKVSEEELRIADELRDLLRRTREALGGNFDPFDPVFRSLKAELERLFTKKNLSEISKDEMRENIGDLESILARARELERKNQLLKAKYDNDAKYARLHKRLLEKAELNVGERKLFEALSDLKREADIRIFQNARLLHNEAFARKEMARIVYEQLQSQHGLHLTPEALNSINTLVMQEYLNEFNGKVPA